MTGNPRQLRLILNRERDESFALYACRGDGKGCNRNRYRKQLKPCDDCVGPLPHYWTVQQVADHIARGDA